jgi:hypothetical protein
MDINKAMIRIVRMFFFGCGEGERETINDRFPVYLGGIYGDFFTH